LITLIHEISHLVAFENLEEILNLMVMNEVSFSTVNDPLYEIFPSQLLPLLADISKTQRPAVIQIQLCLWH
jgi:hypothetical protein